MDLNKESIAKEYREFAELARELTDKELGVTLANSEKREDRYWKHVLGMLEMYNVRFNGIDKIQVRLDTFKEIQKWNSGEGHSATLDDYLDINIKQLEKELKEKN